MALGSAGPPGHGITAAPRGDGDHGLKAQCYPPRDFGAGVAVLEDPALIESLEARERLHPAKQEYDSAYHTGGSAIESIT